MDTAYRRGRYRSVTDFEGFTLALHSAPDLSKNGLDKLYSHRVNVWGEKKQRVRFAFSF